MNVYEKRRRAPMPKGTWAFSRIFCKRGHYLSPENVYPGSGRRCRQCAYVMQRAYRETNRAEVNERNNESRRQRRKRVWTLDMSDAAITRFMSFVEIDVATACWLWTGAIRSTKRHQDYGGFTNHGRDLYAHRYAYLYFNGAIPSELEVMHSCDTPRCVGPDHLTLGTHKENMHDCIARGRFTLGAAR